MSELGSRRPSLTTRLTNILRSKKSRNRLTKPESDSQQPEPQINQRHHLLHHGAVYKPAETNTDEQTGERRDYTALLHGLIHHDSCDSLESRVEDEINLWRPPGERDITKLSSALWKLITHYLSLCDIMCLATSSKTLLHQIGYDHWYYLEAPENREEKIKFLMTLDQKLPNHLLCFSCAVYHRRTKIGNEHLKSASILNPIYNCNGFKRYGFKQPETRLTSSHILPFTFVQLVTRGQKYSLGYGIPVNDLCRRYKDPVGTWFHQTRFYIHKGHLLLRVISWSFAAPGLPASGQRHLLYSREDYWPYFSCCTHWRDGELMAICKCALTHIPDPHSRPQKGLVLQQSKNSSLIGTLCSFCRPMRRCPKCPTEYMVELKLTEDKKDPVATFKQSIVVTRWSDLGDGSSPFHMEWAAINGDTDYDSFAHLGKRAISGIFEAQSGVTVPAQRLISTNPRNEKRGEEGDDWY